MRDEDVRLPQQAMRQIFIQVDVRMQGRWLGQVFDRVAGKRWSVGQKSDGTLFTICKDDRDEGVALTWFLDAEAVRRSDVPKELKRAVELYGQL